jgi:hypothetical protein
MRAISRLVVFFSAEKFVCETASMTRSTRWVINLFKAIRINFWQLFALVLSDFNKWLIMTWSDQLWKQFIFKPSSSQSLWMKMSSRLRKQVKRSRTNRRARTKWYIFECNLANQIDIKWKCLMEGVWRKLFKSHTIWIQRNCIRSSCSRQLWWWKVWRWKWEFKFLINEPICELQSIAVLDLNEMKWMIFAGEQKNQ